MTPKHAAKKAKAEAIRGDITDPASSLRSDDASKLRYLVAWLDLYDDQRAYQGLREVQDDLRRLACIVDALHRRYQLRITPNPPNPTPRARRRSNGKAK